MTKHKPCKWREFFEDDSGRLSMSRLLCFMSFTPATAVLLQTRSDTALGYYLGAFVAGFVGSKVGDAMSARKNA